MAESSKERTKELVLFGNGFEVLGLEELLGFSAKTLGKGTFGYSYRVDLEGRGRDDVVVKRLKVACVSERVYIERVQELGRVVHQNLLPLRGYCCYLNVRRLLYDYMPMGSLFSLLHGEKTPLGWEVRTSIAYGVARGTQHLHSLGANVCHGNIRSSNVFLDKYFHPCLSEFGIAQLVSTESKTSLIAGYCAPEVHNAHQVSQEADVYSFGVLLLELLTAKAPVSNEEGAELPKWVRLMFQEKPINEVFDNELLVKYEDIGEQMVQILQLAITCTFQYPNKRPSMGVVANKIKEICGFIHDNPNGIGDGQTLSLA